MKNKTLIGLDFGSDSIRAVLVTSQGQMLASQVCEYPRWSNGKYCNAKDYCFRQHPLDYLEAMEKVILALLEGQDRLVVAGIAIDTTGSTPCAVDRAGTPLALLSEFSDNPNAMFILWKDHTGIAEAARINACADTWEGVDFRMYEGGVYSCEWFWSKLLHILRNDEKVRSAAFSWVEHCDWITGELAGETDPLTMCRSRCAAGHKAMWHTAWGGLPPDKFLTAVDPLLEGWRDRLYSETHTVDQPVGTLSPKWAEKLRLPSSVIIAGSALDCHVGAIGAGIRPGQMVKAIGTSTCDIMVTAELKNCIPGICGQVDGSVIPGIIGLEAGQSAFGDIYAWFRHFLSYSGNISLEQLEKEAASLAPETNKIIALDWFNGRRTPDANPLLSGAIFGLDLASTPPMVYRALVESTVFGSQAIIAHLQEAGISVTSIVAVGGISWKSEFIMQMCADVFQLPIKVSASKQACALGAAMIAATVAGLYQSLPEAMENMNPGIECEYIPNPALRVFYDTRYARYLELGKMWEESLVNLHK